VTKGSGVVSEYLGNEIKPNQTQHQASGKTQEQMQAVFYLQR
jgi:hypothetical protein